jgi:hypothetical protein
VSATPRHLLDLEVITTNICVNRICRGDCKELYWRGEVSQLEDGVEGSIRRIYFCDFNTEYMSKGLNV